MVPVEPQLSHRIIQNFLTHAHHRQKSTFSKILRGNSQENRFFFQYDRSNFFSVLAWILQEYFLLRRIRLISLSLEVDKGVNPFTEV